jgi:hypothetical protein
MQSRAVNRKNTVLFALLRESLFKLKDIRGTITFGGGPLSLSGCRQHANRNNPIFKSILPEIKILSTNFGVSNLPQQ